MRPSFKAAWWLPGAHLPTIWGKKFRRQPTVHDRCERIATPDGDHLTLARMGRARAGTPHLLILHGLEGTIRAKYAHGLLSRARARGWSGDLLLFRSCDGELNTAPRLYHSGETTDLDLVVRWLHAETPRLRLVICGVSLGGNVLLKWLGESGEQAAAVVERAAAVSVPFDLAAGSRHLERGFSRAYTRHFLSTLRPKALAKARQFPGILDERGIASARSFWDFDDAATAPLHGFRDAADYYRQSSSIGLLGKIRVATTLLSSRDDPFVPPDVLEAVAKLGTESPHLTLNFTDRGGHVGWVEGHPWHPSYYMDRFVVDALG